MCTNEEKGYKTRCGTKVPRPFSWLAWATAMCLLSEMLVEVGNCGPASGSVVLRARLCLQFVSSVALLKGVTRQLLLCLLHTGNN